MERMEAKGGEGRRGVQGHDQEGHGGCGAEGLPLEAGAGYGEGKVGDEGNEHLCIHHLDAIVAHHEMGDQHHDDDVELPPSMFSGSGNANTAAAAGVGGVAAVVAAGLAGGAPVDALCRV